MERFRAQQTRREAAREGDIAARDEQEAYRRIAIAPATPDLLVVSMEILRKTGVDHRAHVLFIDPHPEGGGGNH